MKRLSRLARLANTPLALFVIAGLTATAAAHPLEVIAFGDSMTFGVGDEEGKGYPARLEAKLEEGSQVENLGVPGEATAVGLSRLPSALALGGDAMLLMEGTNDILLVDSGEISLESSVANILAMVEMARDAEIEPVLASIIPRNENTVFDRDNSLTREFVGELRELAFVEQLRFTDSYELFDPEFVPNGRAEYFSTDPEDRVGHLNAAGYEKLAQAFADVLMGNDTAAPVIGNFSPGPLPNEIPPSTSIEVPVYDFSGAAGLDLAETRLLINGKTVTDGLLSEGSADGVKLVHQGQKALGCRAILRVLAQDTAMPPNQLDRTLAVYGVKGRSVLKGDLDFDCRVDGTDLVTLSLRLGADRSDPRYVVVFDFNRNDVIDEFDLEILSRNFGKKTR